MKLTVDHSYSGDAAACHGVPRNTLQDRTSVIKSGVQILFKVKLYRLDKTFLDEFELI